MYFVKTPWWLRSVYPSLTWKMPGKENEVFLTFDDGPHETITPFVLDTLQHYNAKATFFCIGKNVEKNPEIFSRILNEGHSTGNHTYNHLNGWKTDDKIYLQDVIKAREVIESKLFRPPYGRIGRFQIQQLKKLFTIIMWDVLSGDFDVSLSRQQCLQQVVKHTKPGSVVVLHDSEKALPRLEYVLPKALQHFNERGWKCKQIQFT
jgi:peptidoglycan/xylan/chitin deacetylase (PgdA/CDA1 family)